MKTKLKILLMLTVLSGMLYGQSLKHPWWVLDGGGGKSTGGTLRLSASVGQSIAQLSAGGGMTLEEGYIPGQRYLGGAWSSARIAPTTSWNFISVPLQTTDMRKTTLYPAALSSAFNYEPGGYLQMDTLEIGKGYWLKFPNVATLPYSITGRTTSLETLFVFQGWNMIGNLSYPVLITAITPLPPVAITSQYFAYTNGISYYQEDTLKPGLAYWVKSSRAGYIVLKNTGFLASQAPVVAAGNQKGNLDGENGKRFSKFVINDNKGSTGKLLFASTLDQINLDEYEMPPLPPEGLDVRYATGRFAEMPKADKAARQDFPIQITGAEFPVRLSWDAVASECEQIALEVTYAGEKPKQYPLKSGGSVTIREENLIGAKVVFTGNPAKELPKEFALHQNYPNPFNPSTKIRYDLPKNAKVSLKVYNLIGQEVRTLVNGIQEAGFKTIQFDATASGGLPSGVYFYRLQADDFSMVRKLMLLR